MLARFYHHRERLLPCPFLVTSLAKGALLASFHVKKVHPAGVLVTFRLLVAFLVCQVSRGANHHRRVLVINESRFPAYTVQHRVQSRYQLNVMPRGVNDIIPARVSHVTDYRVHLHPVLHASLHERFQVLPVRLLTRGYKGRRDDPVASHGNVCLVTEKGLVHRLVPDPGLLVNGKRDGILDVFKGFFEKVDSLVHQRKGRQSPVGTNPLYQTRASRPGLLQRFPGGNRRENIVDFPGRERGLPDRGLKVTETTLQGNPGRVQVITGKRVGGIEDYRLPF